MRLLRSLVLVGLLAVTGVGLGACKDIGEGFQSIGRAID